MKRLQEDALKAAIQTSKIVLIQGPKNVGKEDLCIHLLRELDTPFALLNGRDKEWEANDLNAIAEGTLVFNDAQHIPNLQGILEATLEGQIQKNLVLLCSFRPVLDDILLEVLETNGMLFSFFAPSFYEAAQHFGIAEESRLLEERLIFGNYPSVLHDLEGAQEELQILIQDVIVSHFGPKDRVNKGDLLHRVMIQLAYSIGEPISYNEIGERVGLDNETVERYINLLCDAFVIVALPSYHQEKRYELKKSFCFYFLDNEVRNALINNFNPTFMRVDMKELWRNYLVAERFKWIKINQLEIDLYFWRSHTKQQLDIVEVHGQHILAYKSDWEKRGKVKIPELFTGYYPEVKSGLLNKNTYWTYLSKK